MKKYLYIPIIAAIAMLFSSCEKSSEQNYTEEDPWAVFLGYMQFSTKVQAEADTRAALATNMRDKNFGVLGYSYSSTTNWDTAKALATPDTFHNQLVTCDANGICTYDIDGSTDEKELKPWAYNTHYSFFAYHPHDGAGITLSGETATNTPTLTYTYGWLNDANGGSTVAIYNSDQMFDLMTAEAIDLDGSSNVNLKFKHRLFAIEVLANNYNENTEGTTDARQTISDLVLRIGGLSRTGMTVPLSMMDGEADPAYISGTVGKTPEGGTTPIVAFGISNKTVTIPAFNETIEDADGTVRGKGVATSISKLGSDGSKGYVMLIPQQQALTFTLNWTGASTSANITNTLTSNMEFKAGTLYQLIINYVGSGITIALIEAGKWDVQDVKYTFE